MNAHDHHGGMGCYGFQDCLPCLGTYPEPPKVKKAKGWFSYKNGKYHDFKRPQKYKMNFLKVKIAKILNLAMGKIWGYYDLEHILF